MFLVRFSDSNSQKTQLIVTLLTNPCNRIFCASNCHTQLIVTLPILVALIHLRPLAIDLLLRVAADLGEIVIS